MENFNSLQIQPTIMKAITELGFEKPSPIQAEALPILLSDPTDFIGLAATGTGKTAAFAIPLINKINPELKAVQAIVLCPTRELALQVTGQINLLGKHKGVRAVAIYGGTNYSDQIHGLKSGSTIVVGTPGRVVDHIEHKTLKLKELNTVVLDEADEMISMGFKEDLEKILDSTSKDIRNIWLFSATMSRGVRTVADQYLNEPKQVHINKKEMLSTTVEQIYYMTHESDKPEVLCRLIDTAENFYGLVFCQTKSLVADLTQYLIQNGYKVDCLHGDKDQNSRERTLKSFREKKVNMLICTDVASRGIDVKDITHVINYSLPREMDNYVHRIGRTARSGKTGYALSLVTNSHRSLVSRIEHMTKSKMKEGKVPSRKDMGGIKITQRLEKFMYQNDFSKAIDLMDEQWKSALSKMSAEEIAGRFLTLTFPEIFSEKRASMPGKPEQEGSDRDRRRNERRQRERDYGRDGGARRENRRDYHSDDRRENRREPRNESSREKRHEFGRENFGEGSRREYSRENIRGNHRDGSRSNFRGGGNQRPARSKNANHQSRSQNSIS